MEAVFFGNKPQVFEGNLIFTSGLLGNFPENLLIGEITTQPELSKDKRTFVCKIKPFADIYSLENILLLKQSEQKKNLPGDVK